MAYLVVAMVFIAAGGKQYYLLGMYPVLFAAVGGPVAAWARGTRARACLLVAAVVLSLLADSLITLPVLPVRWLGPSPVMAIYPDAAGPLVGKGSPLKWPWRTAPRRPARCCWWLTTAGPALGPIRSGSSPARRLERPQRLRALGATARFLHRVRGRRRLSAGPATHMVRPMPAAWVIDNAGDEQRGAGPHGAPFRQGVAEADWVEPRHALDRSLTYVSLPEIRRPAVDRLSDGPSIKQVALDADTPAALRSTIRQRHVPRGTATIGRLELLFTRRCCPSIIRRQPRHIELRRQRQGRPTRTVQCCWFADV